MRKSEMAAIAALMLLSHGFSSTAANAASSLMMAQAGTQASPATAPAQPPAANVAPATTVAPAEKGALSTPACSVKYLEAKVAGKLHGRKWVDFRRDECGKRETTAVFPTAISPKYANDKDQDKARTRTCADQFTANKATNANGGLVWVQKDGGYYAECVMRLKG
ncbi:hypothetical protein [Bradyrhizobium sp.]|uniref:hypothetical protein n=1 Tax=Bradyrhizobium sp. TaxID=376 RepID=UPI002618C541|nr:hypothetical protein [Bradyrhizobium sp.]